MCFRDNELTDHADSMEGIIDKPISEERVSGPGYANQKALLSILSQIT